ncbi:MAG: hypothetical protein KGZ33_04185 [Alkaliphilus sp.]|nr:hypothetical protein [Alkaliphilus sp.]
MKRYTKVIGLMGNYFTKEFEKKKKHKAKTREIKEDTVAKYFHEGDTEVLVYFQESDKSILITPFSSVEEIRRYLGEKFI